MTDIDALWDFSDPAATEQKFSALLAGADVGRAPDYRLQLLTQIARTHGLRDQFAAAHAILDEVGTELGDDETKLVAARLRYLLKRGRVFNSAGAADKARPLFERVWELGRQSGHDRYAIDAAHMMGIAAETPDQQIEWNRRAIAAAESSTDDAARRWLGPLYNNLAWTHHDRGDYAEALELFRKGLAFRQQHPQEAEPLRVAQWSVARVLRSLKRYDEALAMQRDVLAQYERAGKVSGLVLEEVGECLLALGQPGEVAQWFAQAYPELVKEGWEKWEPDRVRRVKELGEAARSSPPA